MPCPIMTAVSAAAGNSTLAVFWCGCEWRRMFIWWMPSWHLFGCPFFKGG